MDLENLTAGQTMLAVFFPFIFGIFIGHCIALVKYIKLKDSHYKNSYKLGVSLEGAIAKGITISYCMTFIGLIIWAIIYNWDKPL